MFTHAYEEGERRLILLCLDGRNEAAALVKELGCWLEELCVGLNAGATLPLLGKQQSLVES
jgi:hypothetical protein